MKYQIKRFTRYGFVGGIGGIVNLIVLYLSVSLGGLHYILGTALGILCAVIVNYAINRAWTFKDDKCKAPFFKGLLKFMVTKSVFDVTYLLLIIPLTELAGIHYLLSALISILCVTIPGYLIISWWVWKSPVWKGGIKDVKA